jgi:glycosyltransferase involved in cell wall biosynthesis
MIQLPGVRLVIGGSGILRTSLEQRATHLGLADRVQFAGFIPDEQLARYYQAADLVVLPSLALEGFGLITLEALACGTPVVATPESGATDVLGALEPTWLAPDREPATLARTVAGVLATIPSQTDMGGRCRAHAEHYGWAGIVGQYEELYRGGWTPP